MFYSHFTPSKEYKLKMGKEIERVSPPKKETGDLFAKEHAAEEEKETEIREDTEDESSPKFSDF